MCQPPTTLLQVLFINSAIILNASTNIYLYTFNDPPTSTMPKGNLVSGRSYFHLVNQSIL